MSVEELVASLLYEGYALYPYTPGATKNATPTPFGIVYPPAYARTLDSTYAHLELQAIVEGGGEVPLAFNFNGTVHYRGDDGRLQLSLVPWSCSAEYRLPVAVWRELIEHYYPRTGWIALREETLLALQREKAKRALPTLDACVEQLLEEDPA